MIILGSAKRRSDEIHNKIVVDIIDMWMQG